MFSLNKSERLCGKSSTTELFLNGRSINDDSFRVIFIELKIIQEKFILKVNLLFQKDMFQELLIGI
tara:strand:- start:125 stop:322 length:198 start_codon:yes stop_codon:yes gene_type:complete